MCKFSLELEFSVMYRMKPGAGSVEQCNPLFSPPEQNQLCLPLKCLSFLLDHSSGWKEVATVQGAAWEDTAANPTFNL